eukprot:COSAG01_NODE_10159_length_2233_cov_92.605904_3_plen_203_part_00
MLALHALWWAGRSYADRAPAALPVMSPMAWVGAGAQLAEALVHFEEHGISHRDVKLDNVLVMGGGSESPSTLDVAVLTMHATLKFWIDLAFHVVFIHATQPLWTLHGNRCRGYAWPTSGLHWTDPLRMQLQLVCLAACLRHHCHLAAPPTGCASTPTQHWCGNHTPVAGARQRMPMRQRRGFGVAMGAMFVPNCAALVNRMV